MNSRTTGQTVHALAFGISLHSRFPRTKAAIEVATFALSRLFLDPSTVNSASIRFAVLLLTLSDMRFLTYFAAVLAATAQAVEPDFEQVNLGRQIFSDTHLSADGQTSCLSCHNPDHAFAGTTKVGIGVNHRSGTRNAPSLIGIAQQQSFFWDGRVEHLTDAVVDPFTNPVDLGLRSDDELLAKIAQRPYASRLEAKCGTIDRGCIALTLAAFVRSLDKPAQTARSLTKQEALGKELFISAGCSDCHVIRGNIPTSDGLFHHAGTVALEGEQLAHVAVEFANNPPPPEKLGHVISTNTALAELGRFAVSKVPTDIAAFQTPSLRNVSITAPYMHDGSIATLNDAVAHEIYYRGFSKSRPISLSNDERRAIVAFLEGGSDRETSN